jgi:hypothetical protein
MEAFPGDVELAANGFHLRRDFLFFLLMIPRDGGRDAFRDGLFV